MSIYMKKKRYVFRFLFLTSKIIYQEIIVCAFLSKMFKAQVSVPQWHFIQSVPNAYWITVCVCACLCVRVCACGWGCVCVGAYKSGGFSKWMHFWLCAHSSTYKQYTSFILCCDNQHICSVFGKRSGLGVSVCVCVHVCVHACVCVCVNVRVHDASSEWSNRRQSKSAWTIVSFCQEVTDRQTDNWG